MATLLESLEKTIREAALLKGGYPMQKSFLEECGKALELAKREKLFIGIAVDQSRDIEVFFKAL